MHYDNRQPQHCQRATTTPPLTPNTTHLASLWVILDKAALGGVALYAAVVCGCVLKGCRLAVDPAAVNADVGCELALAGGELAAKTGWSCLLWQPLDINLVVLTLDLLWVVGGIIEVIVFQGMCVKVASVRKV